MDLKLIMDWYDALSDETRMYFQDKFGEYDMPDRSTKFFEWLIPYRMSYESFKSPAADVKSLSRDSTVDIASMLEYFPTLELFMEDDNIWLRGEGVPPILYAVRRLDPESGCFKLFKV